MRRIATVTIAVPLAACASRMTSGDGYFPVPRINRDPNSCAPILKRSPVMRRLPSRDRFDDLEPVAIADALPIVFGSANDPIVARYGYAVSLRAIRAKRRSSAPRGDRADVR